MLQSVGASLNGTTSFDRTNYFETVPPHALDLALWLEADRMGSLLEAVTQENLDNQRDVVKEEKRQRYDNQPYGNALIDVGGFTLIARIAPANVLARDCLDRMNPRGRETFFEASAQAPAASRAATAFEFSWKLQ